MDLDRLRADLRAQHPGLRHVTFNSVEATAEHIRNVHRTMMSDEGGVQGYLYQLQIEKVKEIRKELELCQQQTNGR